jgi:hypothetical protein
MNKKVIPGIILILFCLTGSAKENNIPFFYFKGKRRRWACIWHTAGTDIIIQL